jgi:hypothetical protein
MKCGSANWVFKILSPSLLEGNVDKMLLNIGYKAVYSVRNLLNNMASRPKTCIFFLQKTTLRFSGSFIYKHLICASWMKCKNEHRMEKATYVQKSVCFISVIAIKSGIGRPDSNLSVEFGTRNPWLRVDQIWTIAASFLIPYNSLYINNHSTICSLSYRQRL